jgi:hypothetical protein
MANMDTSHRKVLRRERGCVDPIMATRLLDVLPDRPWALRRKGHHDSWPGGRDSVLCERSSDSLQAVKACSRVYLEAYTSILMVEKERLVHLSLSSNRTHRSKTCSKIRKNSMIHL